MKRIYETFEYESEFFEDFVGGFAAWNLFRVREEKYDLPPKERQLVARLTYWDAGGDFSVQTFWTDLPLPVLESLIAEAKEKLKGNWD
jgi:hypothetical protein